LAFHPSDAYRGQLTTAGADARVLTALNKAKVIVITGNAEKHSSSEFLDHLAAAGNLIRAKQYQQASQDLDSAQKSGGGPEASFVMGEFFVNRKNGRRRPPPMKRCYRRILILRKLTPS
jgi:hypothetical protein